MQFATGKYIGFLDSDDYVENTMYEYMSLKLDEGHDIVVCDIEYFYENGSSSWILKGLTDFNIKDISKRALLSPMFAWNKLYRAKYFKEENYRYPLNTWYEDLPVTTLMFAKTKKIGYISEPLVHYRQREGSIMSNTKSLRLYEIFNVDLFAIVPKPAAAVNCLLDIVLVDFPVVKDNPPFTTNCLDAKLTLPLPIVPVNGVLELTVNDS